MNSQVFQKLITHTETLLAPQASDSLSNAELLRRFLKDQDQVAFTAIVRRHGPLVWSVCRQLAANEADAEDAYQASFLALLKSAKTIRNPQALGSWLHRVANRICKNSLRSLSRRRKHERSANRSEATRPIAPSTWESWHAIVHEEIDRLPDRYRIPFVLCILQGMPQPEAAVQLGWKPGTLSGRLSKAKQALIQALEKRDLKGTTLAAAIAASGVASAPLSASLVEKCLTLLPASSAIVAPSIGQMAQEATHQGLLSTKALAFSVAVTVSLMAIGTSYLATAQSQNPTPPTPSPKVDAKVEVAQKFDLYGDPLPEGAIGRLGTIQHRAADSNIALTPDGKTVVAASEGNELVIRKFDAATGKLLQTKTLDPITVRRIAISEDAKYLACASYTDDKKHHVRIWDLEKEKLVAEYDVSATGARMLAIHGGTKQLFFVDGQETSPPRQEEMKLWNFEVDPLPKSLREFTRQRNSNQYFDGRAIFSPDGSKLLVQEAGIQFACWDAKKEKLLWEQNRPYLKHFFFDPTSQFVIVKPSFSSWDPIEYWNVKDGSKAKTVEYPDDESATSDLLSISADGKRLVLLSDSRKLLILDGEQKKIVQRIEDPFRKRDVSNIQLPTMVAFAPDGSDFFWRSTVLQRWGIDKGDPKWLQSTQKNGHTEAVLRLKFTRDGSILISESNDGTFCSWDISTFRPLYRFPKESDGLFTLSKGNAIWTNDSYKEKQISLVLRDLKTGKIKQQLIEDNATVTYSSGWSNGMSVTSDGKHLVAIATGNYGNKDYPSNRLYLTTWDLDSKKLIRVQNVASNVSTISLSPDGQSLARFEPNDRSAGIRIVSTSEKSTEKLLDETFSEPINSRACEFVFSPDSSLLATRNISKPLPNTPVKLWDRDTGKELVSFPVDGHVQFVLSPSSRYLLIAGMDGLHGYEIATRKEAFWIPSAVENSRHRADQRKSLALSPNGRTIAYGQRDGTILLFDAGGNVAPLTAATLPKALDAVNGEDAKAAFQAICQLSSQPELSLPALRKIVKGVSEDPKVGEWILQLDSNVFRVREQALGKLREQGSKAKASLLKVLSVTESEEMRSRIQVLLKELDPSQPRKGSDLRDTRIAQVLEMIASPEAKKLLAEVAGLNEQIVLSQEARQALARLKDR